MLRTTQSPPLGSRTKNISGIKVPTFMPPQLTSVSIVPTHPGIGLNYQYASDGVQDPTRYDDYL
jgi:hypothetical protein